MTKNYSVPLITAALGVIVSVLMVFPWATDAVDAPKRLIWAFVAVSLSAMALMRSRSNSTEANKTDTIVGTIIFALFFYMVLRCAFAGFRYRCLLPLCIWALPMILSIAASRLDWSSKSADTFFRLVFFLGVFESFVIYLQYFEFYSYGGTATDGVMRVQDHLVGTIGSSHQTSEFLGLALVSMGLADIRRLWKYILGSSVFVALLLTANKGVIAGLTAAAFVHFILMLADNIRSKTLNFNRLRPVIVAAVIVVGVCISLPAARERLREAVEPMQSISFQSRYWMGKAAVKLWGDNLIFGSGAGEYAYHYMDLLGNVLPEERTLNDLKSLIYAREAHSDLLQFAAEFGLVGLALVICATFLIVKNNPMMIPFLAFTTICSIYNFTWQTPISGPLTGLLFGILFRSSRNAMSSRDNAYCDDGQGGGWQCYPVMLSAIFVFIICTATMVNYPIRGKALAKAANLTMERHQYVKAEAMYKAAVEDYISPEVLTNYALIELELGKYAVAYDLFARCAASGLGYYDAIKNMSIAAEKVGNWEIAANKEFERFKLDRQSFTNTEYFRLVSLLLRVEKFYDAIMIVKIFERHCTAYDHEAWTPEWDNLKGMVVLKLDDPVNAEKYFLKALERKPTLENARQNLKIIRTSNSK